MVGFFVAAPRRCDPVPEERKRMYPSPPQKAKLIVADFDITSRCRTVNRPGSYMIFPRSSRVETYLPHMEGIALQVMAAPPIGAKFIQTELLVAPNGRTTKPRDEDYETFFFVQEGAVELSIGGRQHKMVEGSFAWLPPHELHGVINKTDSTSRVIWLRRRYDEVEGIAIPDAIVAHESDVPALPVDTYMEQHLTPYEGIGFDMGINLQTFDPGAYFSFVEAHVMEHGLYMTKGRGLYWLNHDYIEVAKDDFIYMAPFCPQFYYSTGWEKSQYLLYKDINRDYPVDR
jgi:(S)-ureidoglycine aminohydrolase